MVCKEDRGNEIRAGRKEEGAGQGKVSIHLI